MKANGVEIEQPRADMSPTSKGSSFARGEVFDGKGQITNQNRLSLRSLVLPVRTIQPVGDPPQQVLDGHRAHGFAPNEPLPPDLAETLRATFLSNNNRMW